MKRLLIAILTVFCIANPTWAGGPYKVTGTVYIQTTIDNSQNREPLAGDLVMFSEFSNLVDDAETHTRTDENGQFSLQIPKEGYILITPIGAKIKTIPVEAKDQDLGNIIIESDNSIDASVFIDCANDKLKALKANKGRYLNGACQPTECKTPRYVLKINNDEIYSVSNNIINTTDEKKHPIEKYTATCADQVDKPCTLKTTGVKSAKYIANGTNDIKCIPSECDTPRYKLEHANSALAQCVDQAGTFCYDAEEYYDIYAIEYEYEYDKEKNALNCVPKKCMDDYTPDSKTKKCIPTKCPCGQDEHNNECLDWNFLGTTECKEKPKHADTAKRDCDDRGEYCKILTCLGHEHGDFSKYKLIGDGRNAKCQERKGACTPPKLIPNAKTYIYHNDDTAENRVFCGVDECEDYFTRAGNNLECIPKQCTDQESQRLKAKGATGTAMIQGQCVPTGCDTGYELEDEGTKNAKCIQLKECDLDTEKESNAIGRGVFKSINGEQKCVPQRCKCGFGDKNGKPKDNTCKTEKWSDWQPPLPGDLAPHLISCSARNAIRAYMDCDTDDEAYCRIATCLGDEYDHLSEFYLDKNQKQCVSRVGEQCKTSDTNAKLAVYKKDKTKPNAVFCAIKTCDGDFEPSDDEKSCVESKCTEADIRRLKRSGAKTWEYKNGQCIATACDGSRYELKDNKCFDKVGTECTGHNDVNADGKNGTYYMDGNELKCEPKKCKSNYRLNKTTHRCELRKCTCGQKEQDNECVAWNENDKKCDEMPKNAATAERACDGDREYCKILTCNGYNYDDLSEFYLDKKQNQCVSRVGEKCTPATTIDHGKEYKYRKSDTYYQLFCAVTKCEDTYTPNDDGTECEPSGCTKEQEAKLKAAYATSWKFDKETKECIVRKCETGFRVNKSSNTCEPRDDLLSEEDSQNRIKELKENAKEVEEHEQKLKNRILGTVGIAGGGAGGQMLAVGLAQQKADKDAERDMSAYMATFQCKYGDSTVKSGGDEIQLPGANDAKYAALLSEYKELAESLRVRKAALGMPPGIESNEILDGSELYDDVATGGADGQYVSVADALSGDTDARAELDKQKRTARGLVIGGGVLAGAAVISTVVGDHIVNKDAPKNQAKEINEKYDEMRGEYKPQDK